MRDRLIKLLCGIECEGEETFGDCPQRRDGQCRTVQKLEMCQIGAIADEVLEDGWVRLPCKVGDTVYRVSFVHKKVDALKVEGFLANAASWKVHCTHLIPSWIGNQKEHIYLGFYSFGKTVFLTREEAERALKGGDK